MLNELLQGWGEVFFSNFILHDIIDWDAQSFHGGPQWYTEDPVHMVPAAYEAAATSLLEAVR
jgi:hypothetical protein